MENIIPRKSRPEETDNLEKGKQQWLAWGLYRPLVDSVDRPVVHWVSGDSIMSRVCRKHHEAESRVQKGVKLSTLTHHLKTIFETFCNNVKEVW